MLSSAYPRPMPYRVGSRRYVKRGGCMARITEDARKNIVFLGWDASTADDPCAITEAGTGFLIYCGQGGERGTYLVTAAHVAQGLREDPFVIRVNDAAGNAKLDHIDNAIWHYHQDRTVDIALMRYGLPEWSSLVSL